MTARRGTTRVRPTLPAVGDIDDRDTIRLVLRENDLSPTGIAKESRGIVTKLVERKICGRGSCIHRLTFREPLLERGMNRVTAREARLTQSSHSGTGIGRR